jgi:hypothetical protein
MAARESAATWRTGLRSCTILSLSEDRCLPECRTRSSANSTKYDDCSLGDDELSGPSEISFGNPGGLMDDTSKKSGRNKQPSAHEAWLEKLAPKPGQAPTGVKTYVGLLRQSPSDPDAYELFQTLDMSSSLQIRKEDVVHLEDLATDKSPFGTLGGSKLYVRLGAKITSVRTSTSTFTAGSTAPDDFDLDIRLGARRPLASSSPQTIPDTGCGDACDTIPPFTDPDVGGCQINPLTQGANCQTLGCIPTKAGISICFCPPFTQDCPTANTCNNTCQNTCQTCHTNCGTCQTCATCHTCRTQCGGAICNLQTRLATVCNPHGCVIKG